jgi:hypothetical protein
MPQGEAAPGVHLSTSDGTPSEESLGHPDLIHPASIIALGKEGLLHGT